MDTMRLGHPGCVAPSNDPTNKYKSAITLTPKIKIPSILIIRIGFTLNEVIPSNAKDNIANNVKESVGEGFSSGGAGSVSKGADGKDGLNGANGMNGAKGDRGAQGAAGKDGTNGTDARADNNSGNSNNNSNNNGTSQPARGSGFDAPKAAASNNNNKPDTSKGNGFKDKGGK